MLGISEKQLIELDKGCDDIPFISSVNNFFDIIQKCFVINESNILQNRYYRHLDKKSLLRCVVLLFPGIGNLAVGIYDMIKKDELNSAIAAIQRGSETLRNMSEKFRDDTSSMSILVNLNGLALKYASKRLRDDEGIVRAAFRQNREALQYASLRLRGDKPFMHSLVQEDGSALAYGTERVQSDVAIVGAAVRQAVEATLKYAAPELQNRYRII